MTIYKIYAVDADDHAHRVFMYRVNGEVDWWLFKNTFGLRVLEDDQFFVDQWDGVWFVKEFKEDEDGQ